ncbi:hypothetical protein [Paenibacillus beijingensis]|nr:hypothetical protein [Paenibacillus beijingensis]
MTTDNNLTEEQKQENANREEEAKQIILGVYQRTMQTLQAEFENYSVEGQIINNGNYGPLYAFQLTDQAGHIYSCGFFINELLEKYRGGGDAGEWLSSFYVELMRGGESRPLPQPPQSEDEAKQLFDGHIVPHCAGALREEFAPEQVYVDLDIHEQAGPVLEAGFPSIKEGNNVCAMPFHFLLTLYLLNRDPADPLVQGLYKIREEHGLE